MFPKFLSAYLPLSSFKINGCAGSNCVFILEAASASCCILWGKSITMLLHPNLQCQCLLQYPKVLAIYIAMSHDPCNIHCNVSGPLQYILQLLQYISNAIYIAIVAIYFASIQIHDVSYVALIIINLKEDLAHVAEVVVGGIADDGRERRDCGVELRGDVGGRRHFRS